MPMDITANQNMDENPKPKTTPQAAPGFTDLDEALRRIEGRLEDTKDFERFCMGLGIRLALGMARELRDGKALGSETAAWLQTWQTDYGAESAEKAVSIAREFLLNPENLKKAFAEKLGAPNS
jgi:hypothetical protein